MKLYVHRNLYARGIGLSIVREGVIVFNFWLWHLSGHFYFGKLKHKEESYQNRMLADARAMADLAKVREEFAKEILLEALKLYDVQATEAAYATRDDE